MPLPLASRPSPPRLRELHKGGAETRGGKSHTQDKGSTSCTHAHTHLIPSKVNDCNQISNSIRSNQIPSNSINLYQGNPPACYPSWDRGQAGEQKGKAFWIREVCHSELRQKRSCLRTLPSDRGVDSPLTSQHGFDSDSPWSGSSPKTTATIPASFAIIPKLP